MASSAFYLQTVPCCLQRTYAERCSYQLLVFGVQGVAQYGLHGPKVPTGVTASADMEMGDRVEAPSTVSTSK